MCILIYIYCYPITIGQLIIIIMWWVDWQWSAVTQSPQPVETVDNTGMLFPAFILVFMLAGSEFAYKQNMTLNIPMTFRFNIEIWILHLAIL